MYAHLWRTEELAAIFEERARIATWLEILVALAEAQAECGIIPPHAAETIAREATVDRLDLDLVAAETRTTSHSMLGLIRGLEQMLPRSTAEYVYYGATVQDVTDTWMALAMRAVGRVAWRDLRAIEATLWDIAVAHRDTVMAGRTHGQLASPITLGVKVASWADEIRRHLDRLRDGRDRWLVGQLGGAVGTLGFFGSQGPVLRSRFCANLGLADPGISWLASRDRVAEFVHLLAMITATLGRIGDEIYELERPEIAELREPTTNGSVGSITMPHKRNPEVCEHLVTLARLVRAQAGIVLEAGVHGHERDGRAWKAEWAAFPEACLLTGVSLQLARRVLENLEADPVAMAKNIAITRGYISSERLLAELSPRLGIHRAQTALHDALQSGWRDGLTLREAVARAEGLRGVVDTAMLDRILNHPDPGSSGAMVDFVVARGQEAQQKEGDVWA
jgi:adenylosuccinate lyase